MPGGVDGGEQVPPLPWQVQLQGGQLSPAAHAGHAQAHPPPPLPPPEESCWQTPERHGWPVMHATPSAYQWHASAVSAVHEVESLNAEHGSDGALPASEATTPASDAPPPPPVQLQGGQAWPAAHGGQVQLVTPPEPPLEEPPPDETVPEPEQPQLHGGQLAPAGHAGHAQAQVPSSTQPASVAGPGPGAQSHAHGGQLSPAAQGAHAQVQVPPEPEPPPEQSHSIGGHAPPAGQYSGLTQPQLPSPPERAWQ
jgi:hypothetical protein